MRPTATITPEYTLERAAIELRRNGCGILPVVSNGILCGILDELALAQALAEGVSPLDAVGTVLGEAETIPPYATGAEALRRLADGSGLPLVVTDDMGRPMGVLAGSDLYPRRRAAVRPAIIGGMATPFGVYLTDGNDTAGAKWYGLMATGAILFGLLTLAANISTPIGIWVGVRAASEQLGNTFTSILTFVLFAAGMRIIPLSGTHGAEHQVVHAVERGEELVPEVVRRMPLVHPRCGTNLAAGSAMFLSILSIEWAPDVEVRALTALVVTILTWRRVGGWAQKFLTTKHPNDKQLAGGILAGRELLEKHARTHDSAPTVLTRIWNSGLLLVLAGNFLAFGLFYLLSLVIDLPISVGTM